MKNHLEYFYKISVDKIIKTNNNYKFVLEDDEYLITPYKKNKDQLTQMLKIIKILNGFNLLLHEIVYSINKQVTTNYNNQDYILLKLNIDNNNPIALPDITYLNHIESDKTKENKWLNLWTSKVDYVEHQFSELGNKFPIVSEYFTYYMGLAENAISYLNNTISTVLPTLYDKDCICHFRVSVTDTLIDFYNPLNMTIDHKVRDLSEYLKTCFFNKINYTNELQQYFKYNILSEYGVRLLFSRLLFPTYFFDLYDDIIEQKKEEKDIFSIVNLSEEYEVFLSDIFCYINSYITIPKINWLIN